MDDKKLDALKQCIKKLGSIAVAYSGGVDSTFLLKISHDVLGDKAIAVTATSSTYPQRELNESKKYADLIGAKQVIIESEELNIDGFKKNPTNRCYYCKRELYSKIRKIADENKVQYIVDGANLDDTGDFRPGMKAAAEAGVISPLKDCKLTKSEIRKISKSLGLPTWDKPSFACLSSRFPYGVEINREKLKMIEEAEQYLLNLGFRQIRVRYHDNIARIEVAPEERVKFFDIDLMNKIGNQFKKIGFTYAALDLLGYRTGSMNEVLK